jgi:3-isopropylmalate/(R)-2-methylmalate dehydratase small subunit
MEKLAVHTFESVYPGFYDAVKGDENPILVASDNFGGGSSREQAPAVLKECGVVCIIATSFARIFFRNAVNIGLPVVEVGKQIVERVKKGDKLEIDFIHSQIKNVSRGDDYSFAALPFFVCQILEGGLVAYLRRKGGF